MSWNYRVMKREVSKGEFEFGIYEVFYNDDGSINGWTADSLTPIIDNAEGLKHEMEIMLKAFEEEVVLYKEDK